MLGLARRNRSVEASAQLVLLDDAVQRADVPVVELGLDMIWKAGGSSGAQTLAFVGRENLPWQPCHLRVRSGLASWRRRGRDIADSWTFPDAPNAGRFAVEFDSGDGYGGRVETDVPECVVPEGTIRLRVGEIGPDGRTGPWLSIGPGSPYL